MSKAPARKPTKATAAQIAQKAAPAQKAPTVPHHLSFTLDTVTGAVDRIEAIADDGARRDLSASERSALVQKRGGEPSLEAIVERAFVAGIGYVLGDEEAEDDEPQSEAEEVLLRPMIEHSAAKRLMRREVLRRAVLGHLVRTAPSAGA